MAKRSLLVLACCLLSSAFAHADSDPLASWNDGEAKKAITKFVSTTCDTTSPLFVAPQDRIATFDQDGTLWVEHPIYTQCLFVLDRIRHLAKSRPELNEKEPFKTVIKGNLEEIGHFTEQDWVEILAMADAKISTAEFERDAKEWFTKARHPRFNRPFTDLAYQPMLEVLDYLRKNSYKTYIVTGGGQAFVRVYSEQVYGIPVEQVIGSLEKLQYEPKDGQPALMRLPQLFFNDNFGGKAVGIELFIGKKPKASFGNSTGDREMLEWTAAQNGARLMMLVYHDDPVREYAYGPAGGLADTHVGSFPESLMAEAKEKGWIVISMKRDWKKVFAWQD